MFEKYYFYSTKAKIKEKKSIGIVIVLEKDSNNIRSFSDASDAAKALKVYKTTVIGGVEEMQKIREKKYTQGCVLYPKSSINTTLANGAVV